MTRKEGIGSYFHLEDYQYINDELLKNNFVELNFDYKIFYTGRHALLHILNEIISTKQISKIWFPNYYCQHTLHWIKKAYPDIYIYELNPFEFSDDTIDPAKFATSNDIVIINNYWGLSKMTIEKKKNHPIIIEDHSHGWLSDKCLNSKADYCFVSLRKSLPIPLGGIYWKPGANVSNKKYNFKEDNKFYAIWDLMVKAMQLKTSFISTTNIKDSSSYLPLFYEVEEALNDYTDFVKLSPDHEEFIKSYIHIDTKKIKGENLSILYNKIPENHCFKIVKKENHTAFGLHLLFKNEDFFNSFRKHMVTNGIYPSSLWPDNKINYQWRYFLNIHIDYRYNTKDLNFITLKINEWLDQKTKSE